MTNNIKKSIVFVYLEKSKSFGRFPLMSKRSFLEILVIYFKEHKRKLVFGDFHLFFILVLLQISGLLYFPTLISQKLV